MENRTRAVNDFKLECIGISKSFGEGNEKKLILDDINFRVGDEFVVILGPGQSGKTTLLNIIAGLEEPSTGKVLLEGKEVKGPGPDRGLVFQKYTLFPWKTVMGNVEMGLKLSGMSKKARREMASNYIDLVGLKGFENSYPHELSGGMKQRVSIARAYVNKPKVMLLDEPFGQLDAQTRCLMENEIIRIWQAEKRTIIFVTNNIEEAIFLGDRILSLDGKFPGRLKNIYNIDLDRPRDRADTSFLTIRQKITDETMLIL